MDETHHPAPVAAVGGDGHVAAHPAGHPPSHGSGAAGDDHDHVASHVKKYVIVGVLLLTFTVITVALSYFDFGSMKANIAIGMLVATFKAGLVAAIFMHLSAERRMVYRILVFTAVFVLALFWLTYLHWYDPIVN